MIMGRGYLAGAYALSLLLGVLTVAFPAPAIEGAIGLVFTYVYGFLIMFGGLGCLVAVVIPNYRYEIVFLWGLIGGYATYAIALWSLFFDRLSDYELVPPYGPALVVTVLTIFLIAKLALLTKKSTRLLKATNDRLDC